MTSWLALIVGLAAIAYAWKLSGELATAQRRLERYNKALFDANDEIRQLREEMAEGMARLRVEVMRGAGSLGFHPGMTVREAQMVHEQADQVLAGFHLGGCSHCAVEPDDTLAQVCAERGVDDQVLLANLNALLGHDNGNGTGAQPAVKLPNVQGEW